MSPDCNVDDAKVIFIDRICTCSKLIFQPESNKHCILRQKTKNTPHKDGKSKQTESFQRRRNHKNKQKKTKNM